jgi:PAS domain S-box-containing protein
LALHTIGLKAAPLCSLVLILFVMCAAWNGYGPAVFYFVVTIFVVPVILTPGRPHAVNPLEMALLLGILLLISHLAQMRRRTEASLRLAANTLEQRVAERTSELLRNEETLREQAQLLDLTRDAILTRDQNGLISFWSRGAEQMYGWTAEEAIGKAAEEALGALPDEPLSDARAKLLAAGSWQGEVTHRRRDGSSLTVMTRWALRRNSSGRPCGSLEINSDITDQRRVEEQLRHAQKMESIGLLAGGVAHDFNNLLTVISGYTEMLLAEAAEGSSALDGLTEIRGAAERAAALTQQLLAFSRRQIVQPAVVNLNIIVTDIQKMLKRLIGEDIELVSKLSPDLGNIVADAGHLQQVIMNLVVNARDAMAQGGKLLIETANVECDENYAASHADTHPGPHVMLAVSDTGDGMSDEVKERLFEPFFTTKPKGTGTGLGLATVYGMVKQSGGWIWVYSELGRGSTFKIYFPRTDVSMPSEAPVMRSAARGSESILLVEDQPDVRKLAVSALEKYGYTVYSAGNADEALAFASQFAGVLDLLLTDVIMPGMNGRGLADQLARERPGLRALFMSGYTESAIAHKGVLDAGVEYLQKPFTPESLADRVRQVLGPPPGAAAILVVEDDDSVLRLLSRLLTAAGYVVIEARNGRQALERVRQAGQIDLVIAAISMPEQEGLETIFRLRTERPSLRAIAISGTLGGELAQAAQAVGVTATLSKPIVPNDLLRTVSRLLNT